MIRTSLSKRERYIFIVTVGVIISALMYNFIFEPTIKRWNSINNKIMLKKAMFRKGLRLLEDRDSIINEYNIHAMSLKNMSKILRHTEELADSFGIKTANIRPRPVAKKEIYEEYIIELQIEGELANINKFVSTLIKAPLFITVKRFDLRSITETPSRFKGTLILSKIII